MEIQAETDSCRLIKLLNADQGKAGVHKGREIRR